MRLVSGMHCLDCLLSTVAYLGFYKGPRPGDPQRGSTAKPQQGVWGAPSPEAEGFLQIYA
jgi:hypothetical protein